MKKTLALMLALLCAVTAACAKAPAGEETITGSAADVHSEIISAAGSEEISTFDEALSAENSEGTIGLSADTFGSSVEEGVVSSAMISAVAHMTALIKCNSPEDAAKVRDEIASGFNMQRWVCVIPEKAFVADCGSYVFFAATFADYADALYESFSALAGDGLGEKSDIA